MTLERQILESMQHQEGDYRLWEEKFFQHCSEYILNNDSWSNLLTLSRDYPDIVQAKTEYLVHVFMHETGEQKFDSSKIKFEGTRPFGTSFWDRDFLPNHTFHRTTLASRFGLQRGLMLERFHQFITTGSN